MFKNIISPDVMRRLEEAKDSRALKLQERAFGEDYLFDLKKVAIRTQIDGKTVKAVAEFDLTVKSKPFKVQMEGLGPVHAMDRALKHVLGQFYPLLERLRITCYVVGPASDVLGSEGIVKVMIETSFERESGKRPTKIYTAAQHANLDYANLMALVDSYKVAIAMTGT